MYKYLLKSPLRKIDSVLNRKFPVQPFDPAKIKKNSTPSRHIGHIIREQLIETKKKIRTAKIKETTHATLWNELLRSLKYEQSNVRVGVSYESRRVSAERREAFEAYLMVLDKVRAKLEAYRDEGDVKKAGRVAGETLFETPSQIATRKNLPNRGSHWTDWVPDTVKVVITDMFEQIPYQTKAKRKLPFQRTIKPETKKVSQTALQKLIDRTGKELQVELIKDKIETTPERSRRIAQIHNALQIMQDMQPTDFVPATWHGLIPEYQNKRKTKQLADYTHWTEDENVD